MRGRGNSTKCPHCGASTRTVKTTQVSPTYREITLVCTDPGCGHIFVASIVPVRTLEPSARPDPTVNIPFGRKFATP